MSEVLRKWIDAAGMVAALLLMFLCAGAIFGVGFMSVTGEHVLLISVKDLNDQEENP